MNAYTYVRYTTHALMFIQRTIVHLFTYLQNFIMKIVWLYKYINIFVCMTVFSHMHIYTHVNRVAHAHAQYQNINF